MISKHHNVLLTYGWCRSTYVALRSLTELGLQVSIADEIKHGMCQWSKYSDKCYLYSSPYLREDQFIEDINAILRSSDSTFLLPSHDETMVLARNRAKLLPNVMLPVNEYEKLLLANDKASTAAIARKVDVPVPEIIEWESLDDLAAMDLDDGSFVVKTRTGNSSKGVFYPETKAEILEVMSEVTTKFDLPHGRRPILQERVTGNGWGVSCLYWKGERIASFTHQRLEEKILSGGTSTLRMSKKNDILEGYAHKLLDSLNWHGLAMVEFKFNEDKQKGWFIEINPRLWGSIALASASGVDFPGLLYTAATLGPTAARVQFRGYKEGVVAKWMLGDIIRKIGLLKKGDFKLLAQSMGKHKVDIYDDLKGDDIKATFGQSYYYLKKFFKHRALNPVDKGMVR